MGLLVPTVTGAVAGLVGIMVAASMVAPVVYMEAAPDSVFVPITHAHVTLFINVQIISMALEQGAQSV